MAEICALIGTIGAVCNIVECINKTINLIGDVRSRWKTAELALLSLTSQLTALRAALQEIQRWLETNAEEMHHQLTMDLDITLSCCQLLTTELEAHLSSLQTESNTPDKIRMVMRGQNANDIQKFIDHQTTALTLLLTACNCTTLSEQTKLLEKPRTRKTLARTKTDSLSMMGLRSQDSILSQSTDNMSKLSHVFDFDTEILGSKVYERIFRSSLKQQSVKQQPLRLPIEDPSLTSRPRVKEYFLLLGEEPHLQGCKYPLQCAVHPSDTRVLTMQDSDPRALLRLGTEKAPLAFICMIESSCDPASLDATAEYLAIFQRLKLPTSPPLYVVFLVSNTQHPLQKGPSVRENTVAILMEATPEPFRWFVVHVQDRKRIEQCMRDVVKETYQEHIRKLQLTDETENGITRKDTMMETLGRAEVQTKEQLLSEIEARILEEFITPELTIGRTFFAS